MESGGLVFTLAQQHAREVTARGLTLGQGRCQDLISETDLMQTDFYKEFGDRHDFPGSLSACRRPTVLDSRSNRKPGKYFGEPDILLFQEVLPHFRTAMQIFLKTGTSRQAQLVRLLSVKNEFPA